MRVIEPSSFKQNKSVAKKRKQGTKRAWFAAFVLLSLGAFMIYEVTGSVQNENGTENAVVAAQPAEVSEDAPSGEVRTLEQFSGDELRLFYDNLLQNGTEKVAVPPVITGNDIADSILRSEAELRGYKLRSYSIAEHTPVDGLLLQDPVVDDWIGLKNEMNSLGLEIQLTSGYRSIDDQRSLFLQRMRENGLTEQEVVDGTDPEAMEAVLKRAAPPGYSKHHTGYTIDIWCVGWEFYSFGTSDCFEAISAENYALARQYGFIPSYPDEATLQGPSPEAWEYLWVGDVL